jgi:penicillin-binding protein 1C
VRRWGTAFAALLAAFIGLLAYGLAQPLPAHVAARLAPAVVLDAQGALLREGRDAEGLRARVTSLDALPTFYVEALLASEDHRFRWHPGVDPLALLRALWLNARAGRVVSGGSTIAMQLARLGYGLPHDLSGKVQELVLAPYLTWKLGRAEVLRAYVNLVPFGRDLRGVGAASWAYFGKPLADLTRTEALTLACLPRAPTAYDPHRHAERLAARRGHVFALLASRGALSEQEVATLRAAPVHLADFRRVFRAPHAVDLALDEARRRVHVEPTRIRTTLDAALQRTAQSACARAVKDLEQRGATGCAAVVMRASRMEVLALVGSPDFQSPHGGQVNAALAPRQPGSALKPFVYAMAFERGLSPGDTILDEPTEFSANFGVYRPANYDRHFHGQVTLREALACSYNVPAAKLLRDVGVEPFLRKLQDLGLTSLTRSAQHYGVGLALGDGEVRLFDLTAAYATLARGGIARPPTLLGEVMLAERVLALPVRRDSRVISPEAAFMVSDVLADPAARRAAFGGSSVLDLPFRASVKTGTSSHYRDNLTLGYAGDYVVGVWVGRHDGAALHGVSGVSGAGPAFRQIMLALSPRVDEVRAPLPEGVTRSRLGERLDLVVRPDAARR